VPEIRGIDEHEIQAEPGSRGSVLRNLLKIKKPHEMALAEMEALEKARRVLMDVYARSHRFSATDVRSIHRQWLGNIYAWAGEYRRVDLSREGFMFARCARIPDLMEDFANRVLMVDTPCCRLAPNALASVLARTHFEITHIHPFREGNSRCAVLLLELMANQAGMRLRKLNYEQLSSSAYASAVRHLRSGNPSELESLLAKSIYCE
jgi:cell filamentation protein